MVDEMKEAVNNPTRTVLLRMMGDGGLLQESAPVSSIELSRNAKGQTQPAVKIYHADAQEAMRIAVSIYEDLCKLYAVEPV